MKFYKLKNNLKNSKEVKEFAEVKGRAKRFSLPYRTGFIIVDNGKIEKMLTGFTLKEIKKLK